jgi:adenosine deaminase
VRLSLERFLLRLPKAELHVHLEGSMRPATLLKLAARHGVELPARDEAGLRDWFKFRDFDHFVQIYLTCSRCLRDPEDFQTLVDDFLAEQERQNVRWSEAHLTIGTHALNGGNPDEILDAVGQAIRAGEKKRGLRMGLIFDIVRNVPRQADLTLEYALRGARDGGPVVALGLSGFEATAPTTPFREHFAEAEQRGLHRTAHAGEHGGPRVIRDAIEIARAERIGHGVRAAEDPSLVEELRARRIPLEVCPSSNVCLGVFPDLASHTFDRLYRAGVPVSVNSDDPPMFETTLTCDYDRLQRTFGYAPSELAGFALASVEQSFLPPAEKRALLGELRQEIPRLAEELLGEAITLRASPEGI